MSNVLIGIVGVMLFIGLALAGASFFGPLVTQSISQAKGNTVVSVLAATASAVVLRNRELETQTPASSTANALYPDYITEQPVNTFSGSPVVLTSSAGSSTTGTAFYVVTGLGTSGDAEDVCSAINQIAGNGVGAGDVSVLVLDRRSGCGTNANGIGPYSAAQYVAFQKIL